MLAATAVASTQASGRLQAAFSGRLSAIARVGARRAVSVRSEAQGSAATDAATGGSSGSSKRRLLGLTAATLAALSVPNV